MVKYNPEVLVFISKPFYYLVTQVDLKAFRVTVGHVLVFISNLFEYTS